MTAFLVALRACAPILAVVFTMTGLALWLAKYSVEDDPADLDDLDNLVDDPTGWNACVRESAEDRAEFTAFDFDEWSFENGWVEQ